LCAGRGAGAGGGRALCFEGVEAVWVRENSDGILRCRRTEFGAGGQKYGSVVRDTGCKGEARYMVKVLEKLVDA